LEAVEDAWPRLTRFVNNDSIRNPTIVGGTARIATSAIIRALELKDAVSIDDNDLDQLIDKRWCWGAQRAALDNHFDLAEFDGQCRAVKPESDQVTCANALRGRQILDVRQRLLLS